MKKKIIGIWICLLFVSMTALPAIGDLNAAAVKTQEIKKSSNTCPSLISGSTNLTYMVAGKGLRVLRSYWLHVPPSYNGSEPVPLVIVLHGSTKFDIQNPTSFFHYCFLEYYTDFSTKADQEGFIVVYPNAKFVLRDPFLKAWLLYEYNFKWYPSWQNKLVDDIGFIDDLIDTMEQKYTINTSRIYVTGYSAGAFLSYSIGSYLSDKVAAIAPVEGAIGGRSDDKEPFYYTPTPEHPVSVIAFHGTADENVPYNGSDKFVSVNTSISFWVEHNGCDPIPDKNTSASGKIIRETYQNGENGTEVVLYTIIGGTHIWPGNTVHDPIGEISATDLMWDFFVAHPKR